MFTPACSHSQPTRPDGKRCPRLSPRSVGLLLLGMVLLTRSSEAAVPPDHAERMTRGLATFHRTVAQALKEHCVQCHGGEKTKGGLDLVTREDLLKGGADGPAIVPFAARESRLLKLLRHEEEPHMPEKKPRLSEAILEEISRWIDDGAPYEGPLIEGRKPGRNGGIITEEDRKWWAFRPLARVEPPAIQPGHAGDDLPMDRFIRARAAEKTLTLTGAADRVTLIRRASLDLTGLPPTPEEVDAFVADNSPDAWPRLIDRLLDSPHHGERWARHWLDIARFAESSGFEHDYDRDGAFHYRDFVIKAFNSDMPYDQFLRWQLAGDEFEPDNALAASATGFLGAGVFPTQITANEVERTRYDALDDMLSTTGSAFLGLTLGCARCHDHKYDPVPSADYYRMLSTFTTTVRSVVDLDLTPEKTRDELKVWTEARERISDELALKEQALKPRFESWLGGDAIRAESANWTLLELTNLVSKGGATFKALDDGSHLVEGKNADRDDYTFIGSSPLRRITGLRLEALAHPSLKHGGPGRADNGNFALSRIRVLARPASGGDFAEVPIARAAADFEQNSTSLSAAASLDDQPSTGWAVDPQFGKDHAAAFQFAEPVSFPDGATLKVQLEFKVNSRHSLGRPRLAVTAEDRPGPAGEVAPAAVAALLQRSGDPGFAAHLDAAARDTLFHWWKRRDASWRQEAARLEEHERKRPDGRTKVLICAEGHPALRMHSQGADFFNETYFLKRGNTDQKDGVAPQGFLRVLMPGGDDPARWQWQPPEGARYSGRRRALANWLTDVEHGAGALVARVAVNRLWQHHFGRGLVASPDDFGRTGTPPSHPELLDWLAGELIRNGWRLKPIHRLLMTSATYRQAALTDPARAKADPDNALFTRRVPHRLEGEIIRDNMLAVSGALDRTMFGRGTRDEMSRRRSIYFTIKRSGLIGSMVAFDLPEPLVSQGLRPVTTVAPQALLLMNGPQVRDWADAFATRLESETSPTAPLDQVITRAYRVALSRPPRPVELDKAVTFLERQMESYQPAKKRDARHQALTDFCQVLFGLNEFAYLP